jgi:competence protein ComGC
MLSVIYSIPCSDNASTNILVGIENCLVLLLLSTLLIAALLDLEPALAHVFLSDKNASQLAIVNQLKTKLQLVSYNLEHSDKNLALKHLEDATEIQTTKNNISSFSVPYLGYLHQLIESIPVDSEQTESLLQINETVEDASRFLDNKIVSDIDDRDL